MSILLFKNPDKLDSLSGFFSLSGFVIAKFQSIPFPLISSLIRLTALSCLLSSYGLWLLASIFYPTYPRKNNAWYGFMPFQTQNIIAAIIGIAGILIAVVAAFFWPSMLVIGSWLVMASNVLWSISEYHKYKNPPPDAIHYISDKQYDYFKYATTMTGLSLISALTLTLCLVLPQIALPIMLASTLSGLVVTALAINFWGNVNFDYINHTEMKIQPTGLKGLLHSDCTKNKRPTIEPSPPKHFKSPINTSIPDTIIEKPLYPAFN